MPISVIITRKTTVYDVGRIKGLKWAWAHLARTEDVRWIKALVEAKRGAKVSGQIVWLGHIGEDWYKTM